MTDNVQRLSVLFFKYGLEALDDVERQELNDWRQQSAANEQSFQKMISNAARTSELDTFRAIDLEKADNWELLSKQLPQTKVTYLFNWKKYIAAACLLAVLASGAYFLLYTPAKKPALASATVPVKADLPPGGNRATLTLGNGQIITLDAAQNGSLAKQGATNITKVNAGRLAYQASASASAEVYFNTVRVPRGGQYQVVLPDGTGVWMNAASSLRFPTAFAGEERTVELTGEAYFEVAKNKRQPFVVQLPGNKKVEVLGTSFNIMAYEDEPGIKTTLLDGAVKVSAAANTVLLHPGTQAVIEKTVSNNTGIKVVKDADLEETMAWKNDNFVFKKASIQQIMRQIARWYDVEIVYKGEPVTIQFYSELPRNSKVSTVFQSLEATGNVHFEIEGKKIIVSR